MKTPLLITIKHGEEAHTRIWKGAKPFAIGHPFRWVLEREGLGVRIRDLDDSRSSGQRQSSSYVEPEVINSGMLVVLPNSRAAVRIRSAATIEPAFESRPNPRGNPQVYCCMGTWSLGSQRIGDEFIGKAHEQEIFKISRSGSRFMLRSAADELVLETPSVKQEIRAGEIHFFTLSELSQLIVRFKLLSWVFSAVENVSLPVLTAQHADDQQLAFRKFLVASLVGLVLFGATLALWPRSDTSKNTIAPQFVRLQVSDRMRRATAASAPGSQSKAAASQPKAATVQAFRAQALNSAVSGLMKGGMTRLLQDSEFVAGTDQSVAARALISAKSKQLLSTAPVIGAIGTKSITVGAIGGAGLDSAGNGMGVGYGSGVHASVGGQGKSFVSLDTGASDVEEGLSKEEVGAVIHRHIKEVRYCYEAAMVHTPSVEGKLVVGFTIAAAGAVRSSEIKSSSLTDSGLGECVLRHLNSWRFPKTKGGINVSVTYPFVFKSLDG